MAAGEKGLKKDAIGFSDGLTIALASTALAAVIGAGFLKSATITPEPAPAEVE